MEFTWIDFGIVIILLVSTLIAVFRGFVKEVVSLFSLVAAIWLAVAFFDQVAHLLPAGIDETTFDLGDNEFKMSKLRAVIAFASIAIGVLITGAVLNHVLGKVTRLPVLSGVDRVLGAVFGFARGGAVVVLVILVAALSSFPRSEIWESSRLLPVFEVGAQAVIDFVPPEYSRYFMLDGTESHINSYSL